MNSSPLAPFLATPEPADLGPGPRAGVVPLAALNAKLDTALAAWKPTGTTAELVRAVVLLWHDHLEAAHALAQEIDNPDGSYVHAIMHRREPDYENAKYWFRRVGRHPAFVELETRAAELLKKAGQSESVGRLAPDGRWDAFAFVDACEAAAHPRTGTEARAGALRQIQKVEFEILLSRFGAALLE